MNPLPPSAPPPALGHGLPPGQTKTSYNSAFVRVEKFVFDPTLVKGFFHSAANSTSTPVTDVLYDSHHVSIEDPKQALFFYLCRHTRPQEVATAL